jgi:hypothetical protein
MELPRRRFLHLAAGAAAVLPLSRFAWAQTYPTRPVRLVVGYAAGGGTDIAVRLIGQWLSERLGRQFIPIDGKPPGKAAEAALGIGMTICRLQRAVSRLGFPSGSWLPLEPDSHMSFVRI